MSGAFERSVSSMPATMTSAQVSLYRDGAWGMGTATYQITVPAGSTDSVRVYIGDSYTNWPGISLSVEGGGSISVNTSATPFAGYVLTGADLNGDGILTVTISAQTWVMDGIDIVQGAASNLPPAPQLATVTGGAPGAAPVAPLTESQLAPVTTRAIAMWESVGITPAQETLLKSVRYQIADLSREGALGLTVVSTPIVRLDATADGRGWFIDTASGFDGVFRQVAATEALALPGTAAFGRYDLLTVVEHELGHVLGLDDLNTAAVPYDLMAEFLAPGVRRWAGAIGAEGQTSSVKWLGISSTAPIGQEHPTPAPPLATDPSPRILPEIANLQTLSAPEYDGKQLRWAAEMVSVEEEWPIVLGVQVG